METIKVHVVQYPDRANLVMRYTDPGTGRMAARSTGTTNRREAERQAAKWEAELQSGRYSKSSRMKWADFRDYYAANALPALADSSVLTYEATLNVFERICKPQRLADVTTFATQLRKAGRSEATIARHLRHLKAAMRWANREGLLPSLPAFTMPKRIKGAKLMRGRPITLEEFERMLSATTKIVGEANAEPWKFYLRGLWESGLRLSESLALRWDDAPGAIVVDLDGRRPMLRIPAEAQKANRDEVLPITPEFARHLQGVPAALRRGRVFKLPGVESLTRHVVGPIVSDIGEKAGVVVDADTGKTASAHDLRRAFGQRWAARVMPNVLRELMRHAEIGTTMKFYVGQNAEATADALWEAAGNNSGNTQESAKGGKSKSAVKTSTGGGT